MPFLNDAPGQLAGHHIRISRAVEKITTHEFQFLLEVTPSMIIKLDTVVILTPIFLILGVLVVFLGGWIGQVYLICDLSLGGLRAVDAPQVANIPVVESGNEQGEVARI